MCMGVVVVVITDVAEFGIQLSKIKGNSYPEGRDPDVCVYIRVRMYTGGVSGSVGCLCLTSNDSPRPGALYNYHYSGIR